MTSNAAPDTAADRPCWICGENPADPRPPEPEFPVFGAPVCRECNGVVAAPYHDSWRRLARHLRENWREIAVRGSFDLSKVFGAGTAGEAVKVQLFFVKTLGCRLWADGIGVDLRSFAAALRTGAAHPEVVLLAASGSSPSGRLSSHDLQVSVLRQGEEVYSALWTYLIHPLAIKICYVKRGAPVREPIGHPWHPTRQRKIVKLSPYKGDVEPLVARRDLRI